MVALDAVHASNALIPTALPPGLVAVFVGATSGIGDATLKAFVSAAVRPRVYVVARSPDKGARVLAECKALCPEGHFEFIRADCDRMRDVAAAAARILAQETVVHILFMSQGDPAFERTPTAEGLTTFLAGPYYARTLIAHRLLPLLRAAAAAPGGLARVVTVAGGTGEGALDADDLRAERIPLARLKPHASTLLTLTLAALAKEAGPGVAFVHDFPGFVRTPYQDRMRGPLGALARGAHALAGRWLCVPLAESAARHVFVCTSTAYGGAGVPVPPGAARVCGVDGDVGGIGVFSIDEKGDGAGNKVVELLRGYREAGWVERLDELWKEDVEKALGAKLD